jgi:hypothetical protein
VGLVEWRERMGYLRMWYVAGDLKGDTDVIVKMFDWRSVKKADTSDVCRSVVAWRGVA